MKNLNKDYENIDFVLNQKIVEALIFSSAEPVSYSELQNTLTDNKQLDKILLKTTHGWLNLLDFIPKNIKDKLEIKSSLASHFVASLELVKEGDISLRQDNFNDKILISSKNK